MKKLRFPFVALVLIFLAVAYLVTRPAPAPLGKEPEQESGAPSVSSSESLSEAASPQSPTSQSAKDSAPRATSAPQAVKSSPDFAPLNPAEIAVARSEMKVTLAGIYGAQKSFYAEYGRYSTDLNALGYSPEGEKRMSRAGFLRPFQPEVFAGSEDPNSLNIDQFENKVFKFSRSAVGVSLGNLSRYCRQGCTADNDQFELIAAAQLSPGAEPDVWVINQNKELIHVNDGAPR